MQSSPPAACPPLCDVTPCSITTLQCSTVQYSTVRDTLYYYNTAVPGPSIVITPVHLMSADMYKLFDEVRNGEYNSTVL